MTDYFTSSLLIAMPTLRDPNFTRSVCLICAHNEDGAMGIIINQPVGITFRELMKQLSQPCTSIHHGEQPVFKGGPVGVEQGFILHDGPTEWQSTLDIGNDVGLTTSADILEHIGTDTGPDQFLVALGYSGWGPGQLESEIAENSWLIAPSTSDLIFGTDYQTKWLDCGKQLGIDLNLIASTAGHG